MTNTNTNTNTNTIKSTKTVNPYWTDENKFKAFKLTPEANDPNDYLNEDGTIDMDAIMLPCGPCCSEWPECGDLIADGDETLNKEGITNASDEECLKKAHNDIIASLNKEYGEGNVFVTQPYYL